MFAAAGTSRRMLGLLHAILQRNRITIDDGVSLHEGLVQTTGFAQGDNLSPICFAMLIRDLPHRIEFKHRMVEVLIFADDLFLFSTSRFHLQQAIHSLSEFIREVGLGMRQNAKILLFAKEAA